MRRLAASIFNTIFPDECRLCEAALVDISRIPVCSACLSLPQPLNAEFFCLTCQTPFVDGHPLNADGVCAFCLDSEVNFDATYSFGSYDGALRELIHLFKYARVESLAKPLSRMIGSAVPVDERFDLIMAMPMHWRKRWERGFNQAELLASPIAKRHGLKLGTQLRRNRYTRAQAGLRESERRENLKDSFRVIRPEQVMGKRVLLIDDVFTTGATLRAATAALKAAGARYVCGLTLARVDRRREDMTYKALTGQKSRKPGSFKEKVVCDEQQVWSVSDAKSRPAT